MSPPPGLTCRVHASAHEIAADDWAALERGDNPFLERAFFLALEDSGAVGHRTGWVPHHLGLYEGGSPDAPTPARLLALVPAFLKAHSWGEYVFDHHWAEAYERAGGRYYPKLLAAVPFTPVTGPRILLRRDLDPARRASLRAAALARLWDEALRLGVSGAHVDFLTEAEAALGRASGWLVRSDRQFHWVNRGWRDFDEFLGSLKAARRKQIRRERRRATAGLKIVWRPAAALSEEDTAFVHRCYVTTVRKRGGWPYLSLESFRRLFATMGDRFEVVIALAGAQPIAMALHALGGDVLYGRYWGAVEDRPFLHFELCYYQAIARAIRDGLKRVEAGAQEPHKLQRGYAPHATWSIHRFVDPRMQEAVAAALRIERREVALEHRLLARHLPFRRPDAAGGPDGGD